MKTIYFNAIGLILALLCVGFTACQESPGATPGEPTSTYISLSTKSINQDIAGKQINTVRVMLLNTATNHMIEINRFVGSPASPLIIPVKTGVYDVYVVANEEANNVENAALTSAYNFPSLRNVSLPFSLSNRDLTNVPMFGVVKNVTITAPASGDSSPTNLASVSIGSVAHGSTLPVEMVRMASKVNIKIISSNKTLTGASLNNIPNQIPLFEDVLISSVLKGTKSIDTNLFELTESTTDKAGHILECKDILIPSWIFADATNISKAIPFEFIIGGDTYTTELGHLLSGATKDYTIKRNHNYSLTVRIKDKTMTTTSIVESWKEEDLNIEDDNPVVPTP